MNYLDKLPKPFFVLAPMDDVTDTVFRQIVAECAAPDLYFTEFTNVDGLQSPGRPRVVEKLKNTDVDQPLVAHIWGKKPENFYKTAQQIASGQLGNFVGIDLNMGCPAKNVVKSGVCSALMNDRPLAQEIIQATQEGAGKKVPVSVKARLGFNEIDFSWHEFLLGHELAMLTIHGRTRKEMSKVPAHWEEIGKITELRDRIAPQTKIVGNGDIMSRQQGLALAEKYKLDGVMIGRGIFQDPFVFAKGETMSSAHFEFFSSDARHRMPDTANSASQKENPNCTRAHSFRSPWEDYSKNQRINLYKKHVDLFEKTWGNNNRPIAPLNKFCKVYINGFDGAKELRAKLMAATSLQQLKDLLAESA